MTGRKERLKGAEISEDLVDEKTMNSSGNTATHEATTRPTYVSTLDLFLVAARPRRRGLLSGASRASTAVVAGTASVLVVSVGMSVLLPGEPALDETDEQDGNEEYE